jgi:hypothetical protein
MNRIKVLAAALVTMCAAVLPTLGTSWAHAVASPAAPSPAASAQARPLADNGSPTASELLAKTKDCNQVSKGKYQTDEDAGSATVAICGTSGAYFWKADMDVDCDGQRTSQCNENTDCCFQDDTSFHQSDGRPLNAAQLPYVVIPLPSSRWSYTSAGLQGGDVVAVIYNGHVEYAVFGDEGPSGIIGEASYATAKALGINPDPSNGGVDSGVTYIVFKNSRVSPIEDHAAAVARGRALAKQFVQNN